MRDSKPTTLASLLAAVAIASGGVNIPAPTYSPRIKYRPKRDTEQEREIADWNEAVERKRAEKKARKEQA